MGRGRPLKSKIRQNIVNILYHLRSAHGYEIYSHYKELFPQVTLRSIYYHLSKGLETKELILEEERKEKGEFSWGPETTRRYYALGPNANPRSSPRVKLYFETKDDKPGR